MAWLLRIHFIKTRNFGLSYGEVFMKKVWKEKISSVAFLDHHRISASTNEIITGQSSLKNKDGI
jgi:hypothetical protein